LLAGVYDLPEEAYYYYQNCFGEFLFTLSRTEKRIEYYSHEMLAREEVQGNERWNVY